MEKRTANFTEETTETLVRGVIQRHDILLKKFNNVEVSATTKKLAWESITEEVDAVSQQKRTSRQIQKKFADFKSNLKKKAALLKRHAGTTGKYFKIFQLSPSVQV